MLTYAAGEECDVRSVLRRVRHDVVFFFFSSISSSSASAAGSTSSYGLILIHTNA
jgi:hypothetical protein